MQRGHTVWDWSHRSMQSLWKGCLQGKTLTSSPSSNSSRHTLQSVIAFASTVSSAIVMTGKRLRSTRSAGSPGLLAGSVRAMRSCCLHLATDRQRKHRQQQQSTHGRNSAILVAPMASPLVPLDPLLVEPPGLGGGGLYPVPGVQPRYRHVWELVLKM